MRLLFTVLPLWVAVIGLSVSGLHAQESACIITTIAGGTYVPAVDGGLATEAEFAFAEDIQHAPDGSVYIADSGHATIRRIRLDGTMEQVVGNGTRGSSPDGTPAREAQIDPRRLAFDAQGALLFTDGYRIRTITPDGKLATVAGNGSFLFSGDGGPAVDAGIGLHPLMALEANGSLLIAASQHGRIRRITPDGVIQTIAGKAELVDGSFFSSGDGDPAIDANLGHVFSLAVSPDGSIYFYGVVSGSLPEIRRIRTDGIVEPHPSPIGSTGDIAFDAAGNLFVSGLYVYRYESDSWVTVYDGRIAPDISVSPNGELLVLVDDQVFRIENNAETLIAGAGDKALHGDGGPADQAFIGNATGIAVADDSSVYFVDQSFDRVRRITPSGVLEFFAGTEAFGFRTVSGLTPGTGSASVGHVAVAPDGVVYVSGQFHLINQSPGPQSLVAIELDVEPQEVVHR